MTSPAPAGRIDVRSLSVIHQTAAGAVAALAGIDLDVAAKSSIAVVGPSGCGKSTLLGIVGGLDVPTAGTVHVGTEEISRMSDRERARFRRAHVGFVYQSDNLLAYLTVTENVLLQLALRDDRQDHHDDLDRTMDVLVRLGLEDKAQQMPDQLSGGQRQRVAVARAVVHRPGLILADEPTGALDATNADMVVDLLLRAQADIGATLVVVTHNSAAAARLGRQINLRDGAVIADSELLGAR